MIKYSQQPNNIKLAVTDTYNEEKNQERNKKEDISNPLEGDTVVDTDDGSDNN